MGGVARARNSATVVCWPKGLQRSPPGSANRLHPEQALLQALLCMSRRLTIQSFRSSYFSHYERRLKETLQRGIGTKNIQF